MRLQSSRHLLSHKFPQTTNLHNDQLDVAVLCCARKYKCRREMLGYKPTPGGWLTHPKEPVR